MRSSDKAGVKENDFLEPLLPRPSHFTQDALNRKGSNPWNLFMVITVRTSIDTAADRFEPENALELTIEKTKKIGRRPPAQRYFGISTPRKIVFSTLPWYEKPGDFGNIGKGLEKLFPDLLGFAHHTDIKLPAVKEKTVVRGNLGSPQDNRAYWQLKLDLLCQVETSLHIPQVATYSDDVWLGIQNRFEDSPITSVAHQMSRQEYCINTLFHCDRLKIRRSKRDVFIAEEEIVGLDGKL
jgi:hypothetical protein